MENRFWKKSPEKEFIINSGSLAGLAAIGICLAFASNRRKAFAKARGLPVSLAFGVSWERYMRCAHAARSHYPGDTAPASAENSRVREMAI